MAEEKRRYLRWNKKIRVAYSLRPGVDVDKEIFTEDISEIGLQILIQGRLNVQQVVHLRLEFIYDSVPIVVEAKVVYAKAEKNLYRVGLEFINFDDFDRLRLKRCLEEAEQDLQGET